MFVKRKSQVWVELDRGRMLWREGLRALARPRSGLFDAALESEAQKLVYEIRRDVRDSAQPPRIRVGERDLGEVTDVDADVTRVEQIGP